VIHAAKWPLTIAYGTTTVSLAMDKHTNPRTTHVLERKIVL
jgi:hypothetical protein